MLEKLKQHFGTNFVVYEDDVYKNNEFYWFQTPDNITVGFEKNQVSNMELELLNVFLKPVNMNRIHQYLTAEEQLWSSLLFDNNDNVLLQMEKYQINSFRFIHFSIKEEFEQYSFIEAMKSLFPENVLIIWESNTTGVIIDLDPAITNTVENLFESIVDTINSDFYLEISFYIGLINATIFEAKTKYQWEKKSISIIPHFLKRKVNHIEEFIPYLLFHKTDSEILTQIAEQLLKNVIDEPELIKSIKVFFDCNLNVSLAAKKLYLHRNTLQYRVDKFIEKTGVDIRLFNNAVSVYLALLISKYNK